MTAIPIIPLTCIVNIFCKDYLQLRIQNSIFHFTSTIIFVTFYHTSIILAIFDQFSYRKILWMFCCKDSKNSSGSNINFRDILDPSFAYRYLIYTFSLNDVYIPKCLAWGQIPAVSIIKIFHFQTKFMPSFFNYSLVICINSSLEYFH